MGLGIWFHCLLKHTPASSRGHHRIVRLVMLLTYLSSPFSRSLSLRPKNLTPSLEAYNPLSCPRLPNARLQTHFPSSLCQNLSFPALLKRKRMCPEATGHLQPEDSLSCDGTPAL